jgi:DNA invertase Pin-like site-specific DNA recombinase
MANVLATFAQFERRLISQRTREALAVKRAQGVRLGRPPALDTATARRIRSARKRMTLATSGSVDSPSAVEPVTSQNNTVTVLRCSRATDRPAN